MGVSSLVTVLVDVIVEVIVIATVIVAVHVHVNSTVRVIDIPSTRLLSSTVGDHDQGIVQVHVHGNDHGGSITSTKTATITREL